MNKTKKIAIYSISILVLLTAILETNTVGDYLEENYHDLFEITRIYKKHLPANSLAIITSKDKYKIGEEIFFAVQNKSGKTFHIENECPWEPIEIYRLENNIWKHLEAKSDTIKCSGNDDIELGSYELKGSSLLPWSDIIINKVGLYKFKVEIRGYRNEVEKEFEIIKDPQ